MALHILALSTAQVSGASNTAGFTCVQATPSLSAADVAAIDQGIVDDQKIVSWMLGPSAATLQPGLIFTGTTSGAAATTITSVTFTSPAGSVIAQVVPGMTVTGPGLAPGTQVVSAASTTITLDRGTVAGATTQTFIVTMNNVGGFDGHTLTIPNRGVLRLLPTDYVFLDVYGFPYVVPATSVGAGGAFPFTFT